jgi:hypothetical protein
MVKIIVLDNSQMSAEVLSKPREKLLSESGVELVESGRVREREYLPGSRDIELMAGFGEHPIEDYFPEPTKPSRPPGFGAPCKRGRKKR